MGNIKKLIVLLMFIILAVFINGCVPKNMFQLEIDKFEEPVNEDELTSCLEDSDCEKVPVGCCNCYLGGYFKAINKTYKDYWNQKITIECTDRNETCKAGRIDNVFCRGDIKCIDKKCDLATDYGGTILNQRDQKTPSYEEETYKCETDENCISVNADCCGCTAGGKATTINKDYWLYWLSKWSCGGCAAVMSQHWTCTIATPKCIGGRCDFFVPQEILDTQEGACSRSEGQWVSWASTSDANLCDKTRSTELLFKDYLGMFEGCWCGKDRCWNGKICEYIEGR